MSDSAQEKGKLCVKHLTRSLTVQFDRSTGCACEYLSTKLIGVGKVSWTHSNSRSASMVVILKPFFYVGL